MSEGLAVAAAAEGGGGGGGKLGRTRPRGRSLESIF